MVETIQFSRELKPMNGTASVSTHYSPISQLFLASWEDGISVIGGLQTQNEPEITNGYRLNPGENREKASIFPLLSKSGNIFSAFEDIYANEDSYFSVALIKRGNSGFEPNSGLGIGTILKYTKDSILYQPIFNSANINSYRAESFVAFSDDNKDHNLKNNYILCMMEDGNLQISHIHTNPETLLLASQEVAGAKDKIENANEHTLATNTNTNILKELENLIKPEDLITTNPKSTIANKYLIEGESKTNIAVNYMEKCLLLDSSMLTYEEEMEKFQNQPNSSMGGMGGMFGNVGGNSAVQLTLDKNPLNVSLITVKLSH